MDCSWNLLYRPGKPFSGHRILCREVYCRFTIIIRQQRSFGGVAPSGANHPFVRDCPLFLASPVVNVNEIQRCCIVRCVLHVVLCREPLITLESLFSVWCSEFHRATQQRATSYRATDRVRATTVIFVLRA